MEFTTKVFVLIVSLCTQLSVAAPVHAEIRIADGALTQEALVATSASKERPLALVSLSPVASLMAQMIWKECSCLR